MKYTQVKNNTFQTLQLNAGILVTGFDPSDGSFVSILGATTGGLTIATNPTFSDFGEDVDNCPANTKQMKRLTAFDPVISGTFVAVTPELGKRLVAAGVIDSLNEAHIKPVHQLTDADFVEITAIGDYSDVNTGADAGFLAFSLHNALNTTGFQWSSTKDGKGQFSFEFHGHYDYDDVDTPPFDIYVDAGASSEQPYVRLTKHYIEVPAGGSAVLRAEFVPAYDEDEVQWHSSDSNVVSVIDLVNGTAKATSEGAVGSAATITVIMTVDNVPYSDVCTVVAV